MLPYFVSFWLNGWNTDLGLETERHHIASFDVGGDESLASKSSFQESKLFGESKIDANFWPGQRLSENLFWRPVSMCPFQNGSSTSGILNKLTGSAKFTCDDLCGERWTCGSVLVAVYANLDIDLYDKLSLSKSGIFRSIWVNLVNLLFNTFV